MLQKDQANKIEVAHQIGLAINSIYAGFQPNNSAFVDIKSGANLNVIKDKNVIKALNTYFNNLESIKSVIKTNGENAVEIYYTHDDSFEDGKTPASVLYGRFKEGMEPDVREAFEIDTMATLSESMGYRMYNEALRYTSANTRQLELYNVMKDFNAAITTILNRKCPENED